MNYFKNHRPDHWAKALFYLVLTFAIGIGIWITLTTIKPFLDGVTKADSKTSVTESEGCINNVINGIPHFYGNCKKGK